MKHWIRAFFIAAGFAIAPFSAVAQEASQSPIEAKLVVQRVEFDAETKKEMLISAKTASPGDVLQYTGTYTNLSDTPLAGLVINGPIPDNTIFTTDALKVLDDATFEVLVPGEPWQTLPARKTIKKPDGTEVRVPAGPEDYKEIRWKLSDPLAPEETLTTVYRVKVSR
ncbi:MULTISPECIES: hypothetical protein [Chelativorans]|uniref:Conserved repeat domain n=1 Tax=Chelativorans sp. (strain BNC1) TaxID=266779 RepID=Q11I61_CHESB|nr:MULTISPECIES: hypothetical protein [Chelativorans]